MADYLSAHAAEHSSSHRVVMIGLDGATWTIIDRLVDNGELPTFERLKTEGAYGALRSVDCYFTPPAWTSMLTGYSPERTGVYTFGKWESDKKRFGGVSAMDVEVPMVWDIASRVGKSVAVVNVPVTYPAHEVNGIMVSGFMAPLTYRNVKTPRFVSFEPYDGRFEPDLDARTDEVRLRGVDSLSLNRTEMVLYDTTRDGVLEYDMAALRFLDEPIQVVELGVFSPWFQVALDTLPNGGREPQRVVTRVRVDYKGPFGIDKKPRGSVQYAPFLRLPTDDDLKLTYPKVLARDIEDRFGRYVITLSTYPELIVDELSETEPVLDFFYEYDDWDLFLYILHAPDNIHHGEGFSTRAEEVYRRVDRLLGHLIERLGEDVTLMITSDHGFAEYEYVIDFNWFLYTIGMLGTDKEFFKTIEIDYDEALVFHNQWCLYFNDEQLTPEGLATRGVPIPAGSTPREALVAYLKEKAQQIVEPYTKQAMPVELIDVPQDGAGIPPDMIVVGSYDNYIVEGADLRIRTRQVVRSQKSAFHERNGIYILWGPRIEPGKDGGVRDIEDIAPTMLYLMNLPLGEDMDGEVMLDLIRAPFSENPRLHLSDYVEQRPSFDYSVEELQSLEDKLRTLGYVR